MPSRLTLRLSKFTSISKLAGASAPASFIGGIVQLPFSNLQVTHWNPGATAPLILPVHVVCNTPEDALHANIRANSAVEGRRWVASEAAHDGVAVLVGSGPSLADTIEAIRRHHYNGHTVFAMNGAARYLLNNTILADWQVMIDPRQETEQLVGPARGHLFASQCHPSLFEARPNATLYHLQITGIEDDLPDEHTEHALIGGAASVGNTSCVLAYALGYRTLHLYGYDSSHRDTGSHAFHQAMNDGEPCCTVKWNGKDYRTSLTMKLQAEKFMQTSLALKSLGVRLEVHGSGLLPDMYNTFSGMSEAEKYAHLWCYDEYRAVAPGEDCVDDFLKHFEPGKVIDFGCGTGRPGLRIKEAGFDVLLVDFTENCRDLEAMTLPFLRHDLTQPLPVAAAYGFCTDVLEHIPPPDLETVVQNITAAAGKVNTASTAPTNF